MTSYGPGVTYFTMKEWHLPTANWLSGILSGAILILAQPAVAEDECTSDGGIPTDVIAPIDFDHFRKSLTEAGFTIGGFYVSETFGNTGGINQGETYDGVLWTYLVGDLHKAGLWKGLCFYADSYQI